MTNVFMLGIKVKKHLKISAAVHLLPTFSLHTKPEYGHLCSFFLLVFLIFFLMYSCSLGNCAGFVRNAMGLSQPGFPCSCNPRRTQDIATRDSFPLPLNNDNFQYWKLVITFLDEVTALIYFPNCVHFYEIRWKQDDIK